MVTAMLHLCSGCCLPHLGKCWQFAPIRCLHTGPPPPLPGVKAPSSLMHPQANFLPPLQADAGPLTHEWVSPPPPGASPAHDGGGCGLGEDLRPQEERTATHSSSCAFSGERAAPDAPWAAGSGDHVDSGSAAELMSVQMGSGASGSDGGRAGGLVLWGDWEQLSPLGSSEGSFGVFGALRRLPARMQQLVSGWLCVCYHPQ